MKFEYVCISEGCLVQGSTITINKCPCKAYAKEHCEVCGDKLRKKKTLKDEVLKKMRAAKVALTKGF